MAHLFKDLIAKTQLQSIVSSTPAKKIAPESQPRLLLTVDAEEQFDWRNLETRAHAVCDPSDINRFQRRAAAFGAKPLYFLTYPLLTDDASAAYFRRLQGSGAACCGLHLHQWTTPPFDGRGQDRLGAYYSFQSNLPVAAHRAKLGALADAYERVFGARAIAHRAGRYGLALRDYPLLAEIGVQYDFSPCPGFDFSPQGGPDFSRLSNAPIEVRVRERKILTTPVSGAKALRGTRIFFPQRAAPRASAPTVAMRLTPEGASLEDMKALTRRLVADQTPALVLTLHSTSLTPGANPYATDAAAVEKLLDVVAHYLDWYRGALGGRFIDLNALAELYERPRNGADMLNAPLTGAA